MRQFKKGDVVLCKKFNVRQTLYVNSNGMILQPYIDDTYFNRKAYISETYKEYMDKISGVSHDDLDEYQITFIDDGYSLA